MRMRNQFQRLRSTQQQQVIASVLARSSKTRLLGSKETSLPLPLNSHGDDADAAVDEDAGSSSMNTSATLQAGVMLCTEAQRLLKSEVRSKDLLSDIAVSSPFFAMEAGKLLSIAASFGASIAYPRVQEVCAWIRTHVDSLHTPRQIMSLWTPLMNLTDGATEGVNFVLEVLYEPLLLALQEVGSSSVTQGEEPSPSSSSQLTASGEDFAGNDTGVEEQLVAIASAFCMVAKWSTTYLAGAAETPKGSSSSEIAGAAAAAVLLKAEERAKMLRIAEASVAALARHTSERHGSSDRSHEVAYAALQQLSVSDVVLWLHCLHGLEKTYALTVISTTTESERDEAMRRLSLCYCVLLPLMRHVLQVAQGATAAGAAAGGHLADGRPSIATSSTTAAGAFRVQDVIDLVQAGLYSSVETEHSELVLRHGLQALPGALGVATVREMCTVTQVVNRVRLYRPAALSATLLLSIVAALRPRLFLLRESQAYQLRPQDCSLLLSQLSRWEEVPGVTVSADIVELLFQRFGEQMSMVEAAQLVPFVQALARFEERHRRADQREEGATAEISNKGEASAADNVHAWKEHSTLAHASVASTVSSARHRHRHRAKTVHYFCSSTARVVTQCVQRAVTLASGEDLSSSDRGSSSGASPSAQPSTTRDAAGKFGAPRLSPTDAAQLISAFVQLSSPQVEFAFLKMEPLLAKGLAAYSAAPGVSSPASAAAGAAPQELHARVTLQEAVIRFTGFMAKMQHGKARTSSAEQRAKALLSTMEHTLVDVVRQAGQPKDLVMVSSLVRHKLLGRRSVSADGETEDEDLNFGRSHGSKKASASWCREDVRLAMCFAKQVSAVAAQCNGFEVGALAVSVSSLTAAGALPALMTCQTMQCLWARCADGLAVAAATAADSAETTTTPRTASTPIALTLDDCKRLMDGTRGVLSVLPPSAPKTIPPTVFLEAFSSLCTEVCADMTARATAAANRASDAARGTLRSYAKALADLRRYTALGRSIVSCFAVCSSSSEIDTEPSSPAQTWGLYREAWHTVVGAYLEVMRVVMEGYATEAALSESWWAEPESDSGSARQPPAVPLELLSMTARVVTQLQRLVHRPDGSQKRAHIAEVDLMEDSSMLEGDVAEDLALAAVEEQNSSAARLNNEEERGEDNEDEWTADTQLSLAAVDTAVLEVLGALGDTIALLARQQQQERQQLQSTSPVPSSLDEPAALDELDKDEMPIGVPHVMMNPKHLLMLLQAFEAARYRHPEMLYGILPELRSCANQLEPLQLSLLVRSLTQLGAWNSRLLRVLATAVEARMQNCELRQCHSLLRGLCRSGCVSPDTFVEVRGVAYEDWAHTGTRRSGSPQEPLQRLAESVLWRLDALVRTRDSFFHLSHTADLADLVGVVTALRFFNVPPPPTYDAYVVLAIKKLVSVHAREPSRTLTQQCIAILDAVPGLRQPAQQRASATTVWTVVHRVLNSAHRYPASSGDADDILPPPACWQLWRVACLHSLQYGTETTRVLFKASPPAGVVQHATLFARLQGRLERFVKAYAGAPGPSSGRPTQEGGGPVQGAEVGVGALSTLSSFRQAALHRYALHAAPSLLRNDRELAEHLCGPHTLALRITEQQEDLFSLAKIPRFTAPVAQAKMCLRLVACLLRYDLWGSGSTRADTPSLLAKALQLLWERADFHGLLSTSPQAFSTEELVVLASAAAHLQQTGIASYRSATSLYGDDYASALRLLSDTKIEWDLAAAVDMWALFTRLDAPPADPRLRFSNLSSTAALFAVLARSGDVIVAAFLRLQNAPFSATRTRTFHELLRLFQISGGTDISCFIEVDASVMPQAFSNEPSDCSTKLSDAALFEQKYGELQTCIVSCLGASSRM
ncbi:hypothetical protein ABL78_2648 [Leptomonas seymouri]|uniref:Uncharacterized protein n=1 Tax=Leptomonas seymouri TaxID=5684 RepID=A0A0N0P718_LEPSE|nr:hypothetical protein ABL78_2648 [Leptomonas seymouri]|eukprot:KPI88286.1 hypothetical protein ABL78_2648 [Leptomonas seymouri]